MKSALFVVLLFTGIKISKGSDFQAPVDKPDSTKMESPQQVRSLTKTNPFALFWGPIPLTSEFKLLQEFTTHPYQSVQVGVSILRKSPVLFLFEDTLTRGMNDHYVVKGWRFQIQKRYYARSKWYSPYGVYIAPSFSYSTAIISTELSLRSGYYLKAAHYNASIIVGAQPIVFKFFALDFFGGLGYQNKIWNEHITSKKIVRPIDPNELGLIDIPIKLTAGFSIGFGF